MKAILDWVLALRANRLVRSLVPHLPQTGRGLDIGSGTGHTAQALRRRGSSLPFAEADVVDIHVVGPGPVLVDRTFPFADGTFACALILFVLSYPGDPLPLLREANRVTAGSVLVLQSTYNGWLGYLALRVNEFLWGPIAFLVARMARLIGKRPFTLSVHRLFTRQSLQALFERAGLVVRAVYAQRWPGLPVSRDLFILERHHARQSHIGDHPGAE